MPIPRAAAPAPAPTAPTNQNATLTRANEKSPRQGALLVYTGQGWDKGTVPCPIPHLTNDLASSRNQLPTESPVRRSSWLRLQARRHSISRTSLRARFTQRRHQAAEIPHARCQVRHFGGTAVDDVADVYRGHAIGALRKLVIVHLAVGIERDLPTVIAAPRVGQGAPVAEREHQRRSRVVLLRKLAAATRQHPKKAA